MSKCPSRACVCALLTVWTFVGLAFSAVSAFIYLLPILRVARFKKTVCQIENSFFTTQFFCFCIRDSVKRHCYSYPCLLVHVSFYQMEKDGSVVILYSDDRHQSSVITALPEHQEQCSLRVCEPENDLIIREKIENFSQSYGDKGKLVPCYYDPWNVRYGAVLETVKPGWEVFHWVFWPMFSLMLSIFSCYVFCRRCRRKKSSEGSLDNHIQTTVVPMNSADKNHLNSTSDHLRESLNLERIEKKQRQMSLRSLWMVPLKETV